MKSKSNSSFVFQDEAIFKRGAATSKDPNVARMEKINLFKRQKEAKQALIVCFFHLSFLIASRM